MKRKGKRGSTNKRVCQRGRRGGGFKKQKSMSEWNGATKKKTPFSYIFVGICIYGQSLICVYLPLHLPVFVVCCPFTSRIGCVWLSISVLPLFFCLPCFDPWYSLLSNLFNVKTPGPCTNKETKGSWCCCCRSKLHTQRLSFSFLYVSRTS